MKGANVVPGRVQAALALLERLREYPTLDLGHHTTHGGASIISHETYGDSAHSRLQIDAVNKNHGRRSSNLPSWGQWLLDLLRDVGFTNADKPSQLKLITTAQAHLASTREDLLNQEPLKARTASRSVESTIHEILIQAEDKGQSGNVAQYLVGAKLELRFNISLAIAPANSSDRKNRSDPNAKLGDFHIEDAVIEVAIGLPDQKHLDQVGDIVDNTNHAVWLLTRSDRTESWKSELRRCIGPHLKRVVVTSVESFVGQNISELGSFSIKGQQDKFRELLELYNHKWVRSVGTPGIRIQMS